MDVVPGEEQVLLKPAVDYFDQVTPHEPFEQET